MPQGSGTISGRNAPVRPDAAWLGIASGRNAPVRPDAARLGDRIRQERAGAPRYRKVRGASPSSGRLSSRSGAAIKNLPPLPRGRSEQKVRFGVVNAIF